MEKEVWIKVTPDNLPRKGISVLGASKKWIDSDFNPLGIRECFITTNKGKWCSARWNDNFDNYEADYESAPEYWRLIDLVPPFVHIPKVKIIEVK